MLAARIVCLLAVALATARALRAPEVAPEPAVAASAGPHPNVLLVSIDSLRRDHVGAYGYARDTTPTVDRVAREGVRFDEAVSMSSWTLPSHMSLLTSLAPRQHGVTKVQMRLTGDVVTLASAFHGRGYATAAFVSSPLLAGSYGFARGFDLYDDYSLPQNRRGAADKGATSPALAELASSWLRAWKADGAKQPFFLFLHLWDVHYDYTPPPPYDRLFDPAYAGSLTGENFLHNPAIHPGMDAADLAHLIALYDGEIRYTDDHLASVLAVLDEIGVADDTIVAITADHGDEFLDHGGTGHGLTVYDELVRVPLVLRFPGRVPPGQAIAQQVRHIDVGPTLLGLAGVRPPAGFGSGERFPESERERDLTPWIAAGGGGRRFPRLIAVIESSMIYGYGTGAVRTPQSKLIQYSVAERPHELYDLQSDPGEHTDLSAERPLLADRLAHIRAGWVAALADWQVPATPAEIDPRTREQLRALGYAE